MFKSLALIRSFDKVTKWKFIIRVIIKFIIIIIKFI